MKAPQENIQESQQETVQRVQQEQSTGGEATIADNRSTTVSQRKLKASMESTDNSTPIQRKTRPEPFGKAQEPRSRRNNTGLPDKLKAGIENLSGYSMDDVKVHYNSSKPAQLQAHAYAQGTDIHLATGQEKHLPHEAWHVVQQKQGRVKPTRQLKSKVNINDDVGLEKEADVMGREAMKPPTYSNILKLKQSNLSAKPIQRYEMDGENGIKSIIESALGLQKRRKRYTNARTILTSENIRKVLKDLDKEIVTNIHFPRALMEVIQGARGILKIEEINEVPEFKNKFKQKQLEDYTFEVRHYTDAIYPRVLSKAELINSGATKRGNSGEKDLTHYGNYGYIFTLLVAKKKGTEKPLLKSESRGFLTDKYKYYAKCEIDDIDELWVSHDMLHGKKKINIIGSGSNISKELIKRINYMVSNTEGISGAVDLLGTSIEAKVRASEFRSKMDRWYYRDKPGLPIVYDSQDEIYPPEKLEGTYNQNKIPEWSKNVEM